MLSPLLLFRNGTLVPFTNLAFSLSLFLSSSGGGLFANVPRPLGLGRFRLWRNHGRAKPKTPAIPKRPELSIWSRTQKPAFRACIDHGSSIQSTFRASGGPLTLFWQVVAQAPGFKLDPSVLIASRFKKGESRCPLCFCGFGSTCSHRFTVLKFVARERGASV